MQIFTGDKTFDSTFGTVGSGSGQLSVPKGIALDSAGKIYVVDSGNRRVEIFNSDTTYFNAFGSVGSGDGQFGNPFGIALDSSSKIYVADPPNNRVQIFNSDTSFYKKFGTSGTGNGQFNQPYGIALDTTGKIYVLDGNNHRVQIFNNDATYTYASQYGTSGTGSGQFGTPFGIALDFKGKIYVSDGTNNRIAVLFDPTLWTQAGTTTLGTLTLDQDLTLNNGYNLAIQSMNDITSGSVVSSDGKLTINSGKTLTMNSGSSLSTLGINLNGALQANQAMTLSTPITLGTGNSIKVASGNTLTLDSSAIISGSVALTKDDLGILQTQAINTYTGGTNINAESIAVTDVASLSSGTITMASGASLSVSPSSDMSLTNKLTGAGSLAKAGTFKLTLNNAANDFSGGISHNAGTVAVSDAASLGSGTVTMASSTTLAVTANSAITLNNILAGSGSLTKAGTDILNLGGVNTFSGGISHSAGTISVVDNSNALGTGTTTMASGTVLSVTANSAMSLNNVLAGSGSLTKAGTNVLNLGGANTFSGGITHDSGTVAVTDVAALGDSSNGDITFSNNAILDVTANSPMTLGKKLTGAGSLTKKGTDVLTLSNAANDFSGGIAHDSGTVAVTDVAALGDSSNGDITFSNNAILDVTVSSPMTLGKKLTGAGSLTKKGTNVLTLSNTANDFSGGIAHTSGTVAVTDVAALGDNSNGPITFSNNAILDITANSPMTLAKTLTGAGSLTKKGTDVLNLGGVNNFTGGISNTAGTIAVTNVNALGKWWDCYI